MMPPRRIPIRADELGQAAVSRRDTPRTTPPRQRPCCRWRPCPDEQPGRCALGSGSAGRRGQAGRPWRGLRQGLRESLCVMRISPSSIRHGAEGSPWMATNRSACVRRRLLPQDSARSNTCWPWRWAAPPRRKPSAKSSRGFCPIRVVLRGLNRPRWLCSNMSAGSTRREIRPHAARRLRRIDEIAWRRLPRWSGITTS